MIDYDMKNPVTLEMVQNRILLLSSDEEKISLISHNEIEKYIGEPIVKINDSELYLTSYSSQLLDCCTKFPFLNLKLSGSSGFVPYIHERDTEEYKKNRSAYQRVNDFLFGLVGMRLHGSMQFNKDISSWVLPRAVYYTGMMDGYDGEDVFPNMNYLSTIESLLDRLNIEKHKI